MYVPRYCVALDKGPFNMQATAVRTDGVAAADLNLILEFLFFSDQARSVWQFEQVGDEADTERFISFPQVLWGLRVKTQTKNCLVCLTSFQHGKIASIRESLAF